MVTVDLGTVRGSDLVSNKDGDDVRRMLQVELSNADDVQTIELMGPAGDDSAPQPGSRALIVSVGPAFKVAIALDDGVEPDADPGDKVIYSYDDSGVRIATITLDASGESIEIKTDKAVITMLSAGNVVLYNAKATVTLNTNGIVDINGNFTVDP